MEAMRVDFDPEVQAWYLTLSDVAVAKTVHVSDEVAVDIDEAGDVVGVEFLLAPATVDASVRETLFTRFPSVQEALANLHSAVA